MNRRVIAAAALGAALVLSGCGAGQISQTAAQVAAVNGNAANVGPISLRNVHIVFPDGKDYTNKAGGKAVLAFVAVNTSEETPDELTKVTTDVGTVTVPSGKAKLAPQKSIFSSIDAKGENLRSDEADVATPVLVEITNITKDIAPGLTAAITFTFAKAGDVVVNVPVDAAEVERHVSDKSGPAAGGGH